MDTKTHVTFPSTELVSMQSIQNQQMCKVTLTLTQTCKESRRTRREGLQPDPRAVGMGYKATLTEAVQK